MSKNILTKEQIKEIERVCGKDFEETDIPAFWRKKKENTITDEILQRDLEVAKEMSGIWEEMHGAYQSKDGWVV